jgi:hypothetical protein
VAGQRQPCSWHRVRLSKVATRFGVGRQARDEPVRYLDFTCRGAGTLTRTGRGPLPGCPSVCHLLSVCVSMAVHLCVNGCPSVCQELSICVTLAGRGSLPSCPSVCHRLSVCVSVAVRPCVRTCPFV